jgi:type VI secretion system secreted protein VgrG
MHIPRAGQEVIVDFLEGDPDRPIITGRVYNADNMPPYPLPKNMTQSGIRSRSTKGGTADEYNELMFEDKKGEEKVNLQAQKDLHIEVKNDETDHVAGNRTTDVDKNEKTTIGENEEHWVKGSQKETVDQGVTHTVTQGIQRTVVSGGVTETITGDVSKTVVGGMTQTMTGALTQTAAQGVTINTPAAVTINAVAGITINAPGGSKILAPAGHTVIAPGGQTTVDNFYAKIGGQLKHQFLNFMADHALSMSNVALKIENCGVKLDTAQFAVVNVPIQKEMKKLDLRETILGVYTSALVIMK